MPGGFEDFDAIENVVILRREGTTEDVTNDWDLQGTEYDNSQVSGVPRVINVDSKGGIDEGNAIFTYGMPTRLSVDNPIDDQLLGIKDGGDPIPFDLADRFSGFEGEPTYSATSTNDAVVAVVVDGTELTIQGLVDGEAFVTVKAQDSDNRDFTQFTFKVDVDATIVDVDDLTAEIPVDFELEQNYPNPFNPCYSNSLRITKRIKRSIESIQRIG